MKISYVTNITDPILKAEKKYRKRVRSLLVSEIYYLKFKNSDIKAEDFDFLLSDNGNFTRLKKIASKYSAKAKALDAALDEIEKNGKPLPASLIKKRKALNAEVIKACQEEAKNDFEKITSNQLAIDPTAIIGGEDTTIPVLQISGAFDPRLKNNLPNLRLFQNKTLSLYSKQYEGKFGSSEELKKVRKYLVIHAIDYNGVVKALKNAKKIKYDSVALSLGGPLKSHGAIKNLTIGKQTVKFKYSNSHPTSYLLSIALLLALRDSLKKTVPVHILGLGSPILILLAGYVFKEFKFITMDSTGPFTSDLNDDKIFSISKMDLFNLAAYCIVSKKPFKGKSPYFRTFENKYKPNWKKLFTHFKSTIYAKNLNTKQKTDLIELELRRDTSLLKDNAPFLTPLKLANKKMLPELTIARSFENYWANNSICRKLSSLSSGKAITGYVTEQIEKYKFYASPNYLDAVMECKDIIEKY